MSAVASLPEITIVIDERVSNEKSAILLKQIGVLRRYYRFDVLQGRDTTEDRLVEHLQNKINSPSPPRLLLVPAFRYTTWTKIEGLLGVNRNQGLNWAGYWCEPFPLRKLEEPSVQNQQILLDLFHMDPAEFGILLKSLTDEDQRAGIFALLNPATRVYTNPWYSDLGQGQRSDQILQLPEIRETAWRKRSTAIRIALSALWSLIYEGTLVHPNSLHGTNQLAATLQVGAEGSILVLRLLFKSATVTPSKILIRQFWPRSASFQEPAALLHRYADFLRIHSFTDGPEIEIVVGFLPSAPAMANPDGSRTLWIEPLHRRLLNELPDGADQPDPRVRLLPTGGVRAPVLPESASHPDVIHLQEKIRERERLITELKTGGVGTAPSLPPVETEGLLETFQIRFFDARFQLRNIEAEIRKLELGGAQESMVSQLKQEMDALMNRQRAWIKMIMSTLEKYKREAQS